MKLLKVDNKLIALHLKSANVYNITDNVNYSIKQIIFNKYRFVILTSTKLYILGRKQNNFNLVDLTDDINPTTNINNIKFVANSHEKYNHLYYFAIITTSNNLFVCRIQKYSGKFKSMELKLKNDGKDIVAVSNINLGYIYKQSDGTYNVAEYSHIVDELCTIPTLPTNYVYQHMFLFGTKLQYRSQLRKSLKTIHKDVRHVYNSIYYCTNDNCIRSIIKEKTIFGCHVVDYHVMIDFGTKHKIVLDVRTNVVEHRVNTLIGDRIYNIGCAHYYVVYFLYKNV